MEDKELVAQIGRLAAEEHKLEEAHVGKGLSPDELARLRSLEVALDQCWDLLRQRRARNEFGKSPDEAEIRPADIVEDYRQ
jgi:hypothetical protein